MSAIGRLAAIPTNCPLNHPKMEELDGKKNNPDCDQRRYYHAFLPGPWSRVDGQDSEAGEADKRKCRDKRECNRARSGPNYFIGKQPLHRQSIFTSQSFIGPKSDAAERYKEKRSDQSRRHNLSPDELDIS